jgi:hypothetical protein
MNSFLTGSPEIRENVSTLRKGQEPLYNQLIKSGMKRGAGGAFGSAADYYRDLLEGQDDESQFQAFANPLMRQYREDIVPSLSEQFAGMGAGGLSSSGFRNAQVQGATDLSERLAQIKANLQQFRSGLRQNAAQGLMNLGSQGLQSYSQNMTTQPGSQGFLSSIAPAVGTAIGAYFGGPAGAAAGNAAGSSFGSSFSNSGNNVGRNLGPYGQGGPVASPQSMPPYMNAMQGWR